MKTAEIKWNGKAIKYQTNNTGIVSKDCFGPFEEAGLSKEALLQMDWHQFSKGIVVSIEGKSVRFSNDFLPEGTEKHRSSSGGMSDAAYDVILDKIQKTLDENPDNKKLHERFADEIAAIEERKKRLEAKKTEALATVKALGLTLEDLKALGFN